MEDRFLKDARISRFARLCSNMGLVFGVVLLLLGLMPIFKVVYYLFVLIFAIIVMACWLVSLILLQPFKLDFLQAMFSNQDIFRQVQEFSLKFAPYLCAVAVILGIIAIVLVSRDRSVKRKGRIVAASLAIGFSVVGLIALCLGVLL